MPVDLLTGAKEERTFTWLDRPQPRDLLEGMDPGEIAKRLTPSTVPQDAPTGLGERVSQGVVEGTEMVLSPLHTGLELGGSMAGFPVGAVAGVGSLLGEKIKGGTPEEQAAAYDTAMEKYSGMISGFLSPQIPNKYAAPATELAGKGIEKGLDIVKKAANIKGDWYKDPSKLGLVDSQNS